MHEHKAENLHPAHRERRNSAAPIPDLVTGQAAYRRALLGQLEERFLSSVAARRVMIGLLLLALIIPSIQFLVLLTEVQFAPYREADELRRTALGRWLPTAAAVAEQGPANVDVYGLGHWFPLPPFILMTLVPLSRLGFVTAGVVWAFLKVAGVLLAGWLLIQSLRSGVRHLAAPGNVAQGGTDWRSSDFAVPPGVVIMTAVFGLRPIVSDLQHGNVNIFASSAEFVGEDRLR